MFIHIHRSQNKHFEFVVIVEYGVFVDVACLYRAVARGNEAGGVINVEVVEVEVNAVGLVHDGQQLHVVCIGDRDQ